MDALIHIIDPLKGSTYNDFGMENNDKIPKLKIGDHIRTSKYKKVLTS